MNLRFFISSPRFFLFPGVFLIPPLKDSGQNILKHWEDWFG